MLARIPCVFNGGEHGLSIRSQHDICAMKGLDDHAFLAQTTCKLYAGKKCKRIGTVHIMEIVVWEVPTLMHFSPPQKAYGAWARFARESVSAIPIDTIESQDQLICNSPYKSLLQINLIFESNMQLALYQLLEFWTQRFQRVQQAIVLILRWLFCGLTIHIPSQLLSETSCLKQ